MKYLLIVIKLPSSSSPAFICISIKRNTPFNILSNVWPRSCKTVIPPRKTFLRQIGCIVLQTWQFIVIVRGMTVRKVAKDRKRDRFTKQKQYLKSLWRHRWSANPKKYKTKKEILQTLSNCNSSICQNSLALIIKLL